MPHITEEIYSAMYAETETESIHLSQWPKYEESYVDDEAEVQGDLIIATIRDIRREKNKLGIPLNASLEQLLIYSTNTSHIDNLVLGIEDISATIKAENVEILEGDGGETPVEDYESVTFSFSVKKEGS